MSWLTDLAGKAEDFLNKVDQSAAFALQKESGNSNRILKERISSFTPLSSAVNLSSSVSPNSKLSNKGKQDFAHTKTTPSSPKSKASKVDEDEKLLEFLNSKDNSADNKKNLQPVILGKNITETGAGAGEKQPIQEHHVASMHFEEETTIETNTVLDSTPSKTYDDKNLPLSSEEKDPQTIECETTDSNMASHPSLELENQLLRNELSSLNQEMSQVLKRAKDSEAELNRMKSKFDFYNSHASESDRIIKELQERETDLQQALNAKDSQLAVLRVRLQEADQELSIKKEHMQNLQSERERILQDHSDSSGFHNQALQTLRERLEEAENILERERNHFKMMQDDMTQRLAKLEEEHKQMCTNLLEAQQQVVTEKNRISESTSQIRTLKQNLESARQELSTYKQKAQKILQSKEKLISSLKDTSSSGASMSEVASIAATVELEEIKQERDMLKDELYNANCTTEQLRNDLQDLESQMHNDLELKNEQLVNLEEQVKMESKLKEELIQETSHLKEELQYYKEELTRQKNLYQSRLLDRDNELEKLRKQITMKVMNNSQSELESRLHSLTESLIQKQTMVEALSTEKSSLVLQLERLEQQFKENQSFVRRGNSTAVSVNDDSNVRSRIPSFFLESPFDGRMTRKVKRAYSTLDTLSVQMGIFLRRNPIARIVTVIYMVLLHMLVFLILLTYTPEIHTNLKGPSDQDEDS